MMVLIVGVVPRVSLILKHPNCQLLNGLSADCTWMLNCPRIVHTVHGGRDTTWTRIAKSKASTKNVQLSSFQHSKLAGAIFAWLKPLHCTQLTNLPDLYCPEYSGNVASSHVQPAQVACPSVSFRPSVLSPAALRPCYPVPRARVRVQPSVRPARVLPIDRPSVLPCVRPSVRASVRPTVRSCVCSPARTFVRPPVQHSVLASVYDRQIVPEKSPLAHRNSHAVMVLVNS